MNDEKGSATDFDSSAGESAEDKKKAGAASRARNRTVMLTPEMTGHVRALLQKDPEAGFTKETPHTDPLEELLPPLNEWEHHEARGVKEGSTGRMNREEPAAEKANSWEPEHNPGNSASSLRAVEAKPAHAEPHRWEAEQDHAPKNPTFTVNRTAAAKTAPASTPRAPRSPQEAGRQAAVSISGEKTKIVGFLVSFDKEKVGEVFEIRTGRWLVTSRPTDHGDYILIPDESISPLHAILRATKDGKIQVLDQLSEFGTGVMRAGAKQETEIAGGLESISHGDTVRFGERTFVICVVPPGAVLPKSEERPG